MLEFHNHSNSVIVVLHEIYGVNEHIRQVAEELCETGYDVVCPNLLGTMKPYPYELEDVAYKNFMHIGFLQAAANVRSIISELRCRYSNVYIVGYSVGGTIAWLCSGDPGLADACVCYYGSRIRDYLDMQPQCPTLLLFPRYETSFNVDDVLAKVGKGVNVEIRQYDALHGFADPHNSNYSKVAFKAALEDTLSFVSTAKSQ